MFRICYHLHFHTENGRLFVCKGCGLGVDSKHYYEKYAPIDTEGELISEENIVLWQLHK